MTSARLQYPAFDATFRRLNLLGEGSFGKVYLTEKLPPQIAQSENSNSGNKMGILGLAPLSKDNPRQFIAAKKLKPYPRKKYSSPPITKVEDYPEVAIMHALSHPNVLALKGIVQFDKGYELNHYLLMDFGIQLLEFGRHKEVMLSREQTRCLVQQLVAAVAYLHSQGIMHRDIKPDNIYLMTDGTLKLADFSIATHIAPTAPHLMQAEEEEQEQNQRTANVTTRHYRAPEIIYGSRAYDQSIDIWSLGCTVAELLLGQTLFPGTTDIHQLELIFSLLGCPQDLWPEAAELPYYLEFDNSKKPGGLKQIIPEPDIQLLDWLEGALQLNPKKRPTAAQLLAHEYLQADTSSAKKELGKMCSYLHGKKLKQILKGKQ